MSLRGSKGLTAITLAFSGTLVAASCAASNVDGREFRWTSHDAELVGTLVLPEGDGPHPLAILIPGSGCRARPRAHPFAREHAEQLSSRGVAVFVYDKRGCGESGGDWRTVGLEELADDVSSVLPQLSEDPAIDAERVGMIGLSQGSWISLMVAARSESIRFVVWLSGPPMTPAEQGHAMVEMALEAKGWDAGTVAEALALEV